MKTELWGDTRLRTKYIVITSVYRQCMLTSYLKYLGSTPYTFYGLRYKKNQD